MAKKLASLNKKHLLEQALTKLKENLHLLVKSALEAKEASTHEESKAENEYDTRGLEASYLASGQSKRVEELKQKIYQIENVTLKDYTAEKSGIGISALVRVSIDASTERVFFILPVGGLDLESEGVAVTTLTLESPIGRELYEQSEGYDFSVNDKEYEILEIA